MGIRFSCPNGHKLNVKPFLAGKRGVCPQCGAKFVIPVLPDGADFDAEQAADARQSHSIEIAAPVATKTAVESPSIVISVANAIETTVGPAPDSAFVESPAGFGNEIPSVLDAPAPELTPAAIGPVDAPVQNQIVVRRRLSRPHQILLSMALFVLAIVLAVVLILVLKRDLNRAATEQGGATAAPSEKK